eukprot:SAG25_NODE_10122_length_345_cov_0.841463_1_plen_114_part_11
MSRGRSGGRAWNLLSVGSDGQGLGFHTHSDSWLGLAAGMKRWLLFAPGTFPTAFPSRLLDVELLLRRGWSRQPNGTESPPPMECFQRAGEILYLPAGWTHATQNVGEAVGVGGQ